MDRLLGTEDHFRYRVFPRSQEPVRAMTWTNQMVLYAPVVVPDPPPFARPEI